MEIPSGLAWWRQRADGAAWLARLPRLVEECADVWSLKIERAFPGSHVSFVAPVQLADRDRAVLKLFFPELWENEREATRSRTGTGEAPSGCWRAIASGARC